MVTHARGHRQRRHQHQQRQLHRLRDRAVGREQPRPMEPPQHRGTQDYQPLGGLASHVKEPRTASSPEYLQPDQTHPKPAVRNRDPIHPVRSRW